MQLGTQDVYNKQVTAVIYALGQQGPLQPYLLEFSFVWIPLTSWITRWFGDLLAYHTSQPALVGKTVNLETLIFLLSVLMLA